MQRQVSGGTSSGEGGSTNTSDNWSESEAAACRPEEFLHLRYGGPENNFYVDAIIFKAGRKWRGGKKWKTITFHQKTLGVGHWFAMLFGGKNIVKRA